MKMPKSEIERFVASKEKWIAGKLALTAGQKEQRENFSLAYGDLLTYRDRLYPIEARAVNRIGFDDECFYIPPGLSPEQVKDACIQIYRLLAKRDLTDRVYDFSRQMSVMPYSVRVNNAKTRWGSCSAKRSLNFSWRLIMADDEVIDYVVVHELAHIREMNHSERFWGIVRGVLPDYQERRARLKALQLKLSGEDWG